MHQIIHLSPVGCLTIARGKTVQKNYAVSGVNELYCNMKVIPQYKVIGPYNYDRIIYNLEKINPKR